jgi:hypothetical protein
MKATGNILKWSMNFPRMERSFLRRWAWSLPVRSNCKIAGVHQVLRWQELIHGAVILEVQPA